MFLRKSFAGRFALTLGLTVSATLPSPATAAMELYSIAFNGVGTMPASGTFLYDTTHASFASFTVSWAGQSFDLTAAANAPAVGSACGGGSPSVAATWSLLGHGLCDGLYYRWFGNSSGASSSFSFNASTLALPEQLAARISAEASGSGAPLPEFGTGDWTVSATAMPLTHLIHFSGVGEVPAIGYASYDPSAAHFGLVLVSWNGQWLDMTEAANMPTLGTACPGEVSSPGAGFALLSHGLCDGLYYRWFANDNAPAGSFAFSAATLALPEQLAVRFGVATVAGDLPGGDFGAGEWTLEALSAVPEPSRVLLLLGGLCLLALQGRLVTGRGRMDQRSVAELRVRTNYRRLTARQRH
ncbi:hypothetical protein SNE35_20490 [Paucibacter sp. R3-3]|uniref:PEP-CTERM protein-sorting domain-containing protein n=1 Tax=Roseateles agri TaxID=3098619 RepID=A0ABU5DKS3_9BURK|nr:hypothetical protein [Paucibacter sp. R3-3]MDY0746903.1 hypothetical protein [Paucibacter sp. R3-3]